MKIIETVDHLTVKEHETSLNSNVGLDNNYIPDHCPLDEIQCYRVKLEESDINRVFILWDGTFSDMTDNNTFKLADVNMNALKRPSTHHFFNKQLDLGVNPELAIVFFAQNLGSPLVATDGNHRLMAHFLINKNVADIPAFLYTHENIINWRHFPPLAKEWVEIE